MARFPKKEAEIAALAEQMIAGLRDYPAVFPKPKAYKVQRRIGENWADVATAILSEITLVAQPERTELEYRVIAINKAGEGPESNTVNVVL